MQRSNSDNINGKKDFAKEQIWGSFDSKPIQNQKLDGGHEAGKTFFFLQNDKIIIYFTALERE